MGVRALRFAFFLMLADARDTFVQTGQQVCVLRRIVQRPDKSLRQSRVCQCGDGDGETGQSRRRVLLS